MKREWEGVRSKKEGSEKELRSLSLSRIDSAGKSPIRSRGFTSGSATPTRLSLAGFPPGSTIVPIVLSLATCTHQARPIRRMQRADRELDDKDDYGGGPDFQTTPTATTAPRQPPPDRYKNNDTEENMPPYRSKVRVLDRYQIIGFISSGTYGRVYKARSKLPGNTKEFAIKK